MDLLRELRPALRRLRRAPAFAVAVVGFLGVAIAALTAVAALGWTLTAKPLPFADADRLVVVRAWSKSLGFSLGVSPPLIEEIASMPGVAAVGAWRGRGAVDGWTPASLSSDAFETLGVAPILGRALRSEDRDAVVIAESAWLTRFGRARDVLGRRIHLGDRAYEIVGVMPDRFAFPDARHDAWAPLVLTPEELGADRVGHFGGVQMIARLEPGASAAALTDALVARYGADPRIAALREHMQLEFRAVPLREHFTGGRGEVAGLLGLAAVVVLVATLANLASLWLTRALARRRELEVSAALGADARRRAASVRAEVLVLCAAAGALGVSLAPLGMRLLYVGGIAQADWPVAVALDAEVLAVVAVVVACAALVLAAPAGWLARRAGEGAALRQGVHAIGENRGVGRARRAMIAVQVGIAIALLGSGGLLLRTLSSLWSTDAGFDRRGVVLAQIGGSRPAGQENGVQREAPRLRAALGGTVTRLSAHPALRVAWSSVVPFGGSEAVSTVILPGDAPGQASAAKVRRVSPRYFEVLGVEFLRGRVMTDETEVVVDGALARRMGGEVLGATLRFPTAGGPDEVARVVGVVDTVKQAKLDEVEDQGSYFHLAREPGSNAVDLVIRSELPVGDVGALVEREAQAAGLEVQRLATLDALVLSTLRPRLTLLGAVGGFALFGTAIAILGLYAVLALSARMRSREYGLRRALGADGRALARSVLVDALRIAVPGLIVGAGLSVAATRALASQLYGVEGSDPLAWGLAIAVALGGVLLAAAGPARLAARVDPQLSLRTD